MMQCCAECGSGIFPAVWLLSLLPDFAFTVQRAYRCMLGSDGVVGSVSAGERAVNRTNAFADRCSIFSGAHAEAHLEG